MLEKQKKKTIKKALSSIWKNRNTKLMTIVFILVFASIGTYLILSSSAATILNADFNSDSTVNIYDLSILATNWGKTSATHAQGDANADSTVNVYDLSIVASEWGQVITPSITPTPTGQPANSINIKDYGVVDNPNADSTVMASNTTKLTAALTATKSQSKSIWIPNGSFIFNSLTIPDGITIQGQSMVGAVLKGNFVFGSNLAFNNIKMVFEGGTYLNSVHDIVFENIDFEGRGNGYADADGLILIEGSSYNISFSKCIIGTNTDGVGNGVKVYDTGRYIHNISFDQCTIKYQPRMGIEVIGRANPSEGGTGGKSYQYVDITNSTFEASAGEAISYDDNYSDNINRAGYNTVSGNYVDGAGVGNSYQYGSVIENNGVHNMTWTNNYFGAGRDSIVNISGRDNNPLNMVASGNVYDAKHVPAGVTPNNQVFGIINVRGGARFSDTIINDPNSYSGVWAYINNCDGLDFGSSTVTGISGASSSVYGSGNTNIIWPVKK